MQKIAIIEDDHAIQEMYKLKLEFADFKVVTASDGENGLKLIEAERPDLLFLDIHMPVMSGDKMLAELRKKPWGKNIPVVILTNITPEETPTSLRELRVSDYVVKANSTPQMVLEKAQALLKKG